jgi:hypothetical protein
MLLLTLLLALLLPLRPLLLHSSFGSLCASTTSLLQLVTCAAGPTPTWNSLQEEQQEVQQQQQQQQRPASQCLARQHSSSSMAAALGQVGGGCRHGLCGIIA